MAARFSQPHHDKDPDTCLDGPDRARRWPSPHGHASRRQSRCSRHLRTKWGPGLIGEEVLLEQGFTTREMSALRTGINRFAKRICPFPEFVAILEESVHQTRVNHDTVWKYTFGIKAAPGRRYGVTCLIPNLDHMTYTIRSMSGKVLYKARLRTEGV